MSRQKACLLTLVLLPRTRASCYSYHRTLSFCPTSLAAATPLRDYCPTAFFLPPPRSLGYFFCPTVSQQHHYSTPKLVPYSVYSPTTLLRGGLSPPPGSEGIPSAPWVPVKISYRLSSPSVLPLLAVACPSTTSLPLFSRHFPLVFGTLFFVLVVHESIHPNLDRINSPLSRHSISTPVVASATQQLVVPSISLPPPTLPV